MKTTKVTPEMQKVMNRYPTINFTHTMVDTYGFRMVADRKLIQLSNLWLGHPDHICKRVGEMLGTNDPLRVNWEQSQRKLK